MKTNKNLIEKLRNGEIAIDNQGNPNVELLRAVLKEAFPKDRDSPQGRFKYYYKSTCSEIFLSSNVKLNLPTIPLNDFLEKEFVLPEKWCVEVNEITGNWFDEYGNLNKMHKPSSGYKTTSFKYLAQPHFFNSHIHDYIPNNYTLITFDQFKEHVLKMKETKEQFPKDDFGVIVENNNGKEIIDYLVSKGFNNYYNFKGNKENYSVYVINKGIIDCRSIASKTYTLQQLKNLENNMENKEIIGYRLKQKINGFKNEVGEICKDSKYFPLYQDHPKFEPVYKSKEVVIRMGNSFDLTIKDGKVWHKSDNITQFVQNLVNCFDYVNKDQSYGQYKAQFKDVIFSSTGCERTETKLSEWILVYNELQKQK